MAEPARAADAEGPAEPPWGDVGDPWLASPGVSGRGARRGWVEDPLEPLRGVLGAEVAFRRASPALPQPPTPRGVPPFPPCPPWVSPAPGAAGSSPQGRGLRRSRVTRRARRTVQARAVTLGPLLCLLLERRVCARVFVCV